MKDIGLFGQRRKNLIKAYELLRAAERPQPRNAILQAAHQYQQTDNPLFFWLLDRGFLEEVPFSEVVGPYRGSQRRTPRGIKGFFRTSAKGLEIRRLFERLFDALGLSDQVKARFVE